MLVNIKYIYDFIYIYKKPITCETVLVCVKVFLILSLPFWTSLESMFPL